MLPVKNSNFRPFFSGCRSNPTFLSLIATITIAAAALVVTLSAPASFASTATPTYYGVLFHNVVTSPITVSAGKTLHGIAPVSGTSPNAPAYGVTARAVVYAQGGNTDTTCMVKLAGGAVWGTAITVPAHSTVSIPFEDTSPGYPGENYGVDIVVQAGNGGSLTILPGTSLILEGVPSQPNNNAY